MALVSDDDMLFVREQPDPAAEEITGLPYDASDLRAVGTAASHGSETWWEIESNTFRGWVNARYLAQDVPGGEFRGDARVLRRLDELATVVREQGDLTPVASAKGLVFDVFAPPVLIEPADLPTALEEDATREFGGVECAPGDCPQTVRDVMAGCTSTLPEDSSELVYDEPVGSIGALHAVAYRPPAELANLHYVALYEEDEASGHWSACYVYFTYEAGRPVVAGIGKDATGI